MRTRSLGLAVVALAMAVLAAPAAAAPVTVDLRVEGPTRTLFEGQVTTDVRPFKFTDSAATYTCDGTSANGGPSATAVPTRGAAIAEAAERTPFSLRGTWFAGSGFAGPSFDEIDGERVAYDSTTQQYLVEYKNGQVSSYGSCGDPIISGDRLLFAYGTGSEQLLALSGPATAKPGEAVTVKVTDASSGTAVAGATVDGRPSSADGTVTVGPYDQRGSRDLKATKPGAIRSSRLRVCVSDGQDGFCGSATPAPAAAAPCATTGDDGRCGTADRRPPYGKILSIREQQRFRRGRGPRELRGTVAPEPSGIRDVRLRLTRNDRGRCATFDARRQRLVSMRRCGARRGTWLRIGDRADWTYLLPERLPRGRYVLDLQVVDGAGNRDTTLQRTRNRVVFFVG